MMNLVLFGSVLIHQFVNNSCDLFSRSRIVKLFLDLSLLRFSLMFFWSHFWGNCHLSCHSRFNNSSWCNNLDLYGVYLGSLNCSWVSREIFLGLIYGPWRPVWISSWVWLNICGWCRRDIHESVLQESVLVEDMTQSRALIVDALAASLAHILFAVSTISKSIFFLTFRA